MDGTRSALIVANEQYTDPGLRRLRAPASDARALARVLADPHIGEFEVRTLINEAAPDVNLAVEEFFSDRRPEVQPPGRGRGAHVPCASAGVGDVDPLFR